MKNNQNIVCCSECLVAGACIQALCECHKKIAPSGYFGTVLAQPQEVRKPNTIGSLEGLGKMLQKDLESPSVYELALGIGNPSRISPRR